MRCHDAAQPGKGISLADTFVHILGYADDAVILEDGTPRGINQISTRVNAIAKGSKEDADMILNSDKTEVMYVRSQDEVTPTTVEEAREVCKFT